MNKPSDQNASRGAAQNGGKTQPNQQRTNPSAAKNAGPSQKPGSGNEAPSYKSKPMTDSDMDEDETDQNAAGRDETDQDAPQPGASRDKTRKQYSPKAGKDRQNRPLHAAKGNDEVMSQQERRT